MSQRVPDLADDCTTSTDIIDLRELIRAELAASQEKILSLIADHSEPGRNSTGFFAPPAEPLSLRPLDMLTPDTISKRQREVKTVIESFQQRLTAGHDLGVTVGQFPDATPLRLTAVTFFSSGAVSFVGLDARGKAANVYDTLDNFSLSLKKLRRFNGGEPRSPVRFFTTTD